MHVSHVAGNRRGLLEMEGVFRSAAEQIKRLFSVLLLDRKIGMGGVEGVGLCHRRRGTG